MHGSCSRVSNDAGAGLQHREPKQDQPEPNNLAEGHTDRRGAGMAVEQHADGNQEGKRTPTREGNRGVGLEHRGDQETDERDDHDDSADEAEETSKPGVIPRGCRVVGALPAAGSPLRLHGATLPAVPARVTLAVMPYSQSGGVSPVSIASWRSAVQSKSSPIWNNQIAPAIVTTSTTTATTSHCRRFDTATDCPKWVAAASRSIDNRLYAFE